MKTTEIETVPIDRYLFVKVYTDEGITGLGESGAWGYLEASAAAVETFKRYLIGQDPLRIEHHWRISYPFREGMVANDLDAQNFCRTTGDYLYYPDHPYNAHLPR